MCKPLAILVMLTATPWLAGCGSSLETLNQLAAAGNIHEQAPVTAHLRIQIAAPPAKVWALLIDASNWPKWQKQIASVAVAGPLQNGTRFTWKTGGAQIHSQVQLFDPERRLGWTGTAMTAKAIHVWELEAKPGNQTLVTVRESMDGPFMAQMFPSAKLAETDTEWLKALKHEAEGQPPS
jgi:uncharacterized membrane protein